MFLEPPSLLVSNRDNATNPGYLKVFVRRLTESNRSSIVGSYGTIHALRNLHNNEGKGADQPQQQKQHRNVTYCKFMIIVV